MTVSQRIADHSRECQRTLRRFGIRTGDRRLAEACRCLAPYVTLDAHAARLLRGS